MSADPHTPTSIKSDRSDVVDDAVIRSVVEMLSAASRPLILAGTGIRAAHVEGLLAPLAEALSTPVVTAWTHDTLASEHPLFAGRPGTIGTRAGNFAVQAADVLLVLGSRLNIRQVSYNWDSFAEHARVIHVDIDPSELRKPYLRNEHVIVSDLADFVPRLLENAREFIVDPHSRWVEWTQRIRLEYAPRRSDYPDRPDGINAYHFILALAKVLTGRHIVACGDATATIVPFQVMHLEEGQRLFSNSGCATMGYDLPAALGAAVASPDRPVICLAGDGSVMMNLQELQTLAASGCDVGIIILDNGGYLSIKQTQSNFFGRAHGSSPESGVTFPNFADVTRGFGLPTMELKSSMAWEDGLRAFVSMRGPRACVVQLDQAQEFEPRLKSKMTSTGIVTPPLDDMFPHLPEEELASIRTSARGL